MRTAVLLLWTGCVWTIVRSALALIWTASLWRRILVLAVAALALVSCRRPEEMLSRR